MSAPSTLSLRPCATLAPSRSALPRARFASSSRPAPSLSISCPPRRFKGLRRALAVESGQQASAESSVKQEEKPRTYYFLVANAKFMLDDEEHFQEQLQEKLRLYEERSKEQDFWLVIEPKFLDRFPNVTKRLKRPAVALVSTDRNWIRVLAEQFDAETPEEALASNPAELNFDNPENWTAPYPKYETGWWEAFLPPKSSNGTA
ncbi:unnamed protein product [Alopecurus aequalis]